MTASGDIRRRLRIMRADILDVPADAIFLTMDGASPRLLGNVALQFIRRFPEVDFRGCMEDQIVFPVPLGTAHRLELQQGSPYRLAMLLATLHHEQVLAGDAKVDVIRSAFSRALAESHRAGIRYAVTTVLAGGWRLPVNGAFRAMLDVLAAPAATPAPSLTVCVREGDEALRRLARETGLGE